MVFSWFFPIVRADADEEEEMVDPQVVLKEECGGTKSCMAYKSKLEECTDRVHSRSQTTETCTEELFDFVHCVDGCVSKELFSKLK